MALSDTLHGLGWRQFFQAQMDIECGWTPARVLRVHRNAIEVVHVGGTVTIPLAGKSVALGITVGDWLLIDERAPRVCALLQRFGVFQRKAPGTSGDTQLIAANVDTLFVVTSANRDFNIARLERYLAIAKDASAFPVIVITKADTIDSVDEFVATAARLSPGIVVEALDARCADSVEALRPWCEPGQTVALLGSSGVGKSTLISTLAGVELPTQSAREDDQRGRHTTTGRSMYRLNHGGWLIDTPGMRELQLFAVGDALNEVFRDVSELAAQCRFADCSHESEPGCAVQTAIEAGLLDAERLRRYTKLQAEDRRNTETLAERRARDKNFGKMVKAVMSGKRKQKDGG